MPANRATRLALTAAALLVVGVVVGAAVGLVIRPSGRASAASAAPSGPVDHPTGAADVLLRVATQPADSGSIAPVPQVSLYGDGSVIVASAAAAGTESSSQSPAIADLRQLRLSEAGIQDVLRQAEAAGLTGPSATETGAVGAPFDRLVFSMSVTGMHREQVLAGDLAERARFALFSAALLDLPSWLPAGTVTAPAEYTAPRLAVYVGSSRANPPAGSVAAAWPLDASPSARLARFGGPSPVAGFRCGVLEGAARDRVIAAARAATAETLWRSGSRVYQVVFRPLLPDQPGC